MLEKTVNEYFLLRHGRSLANKSGIIISSLDDGIRDWGLADGSCFDIEKSLKEYSFTSETLIISSPLRRAVETAGCAASFIGIKHIQTSEALRERYFGSFDKKSDENYPLIWQQDAKDAGNRINGVESTQEVFKRLEAFIFETEILYRDKTIILVSHGDPLNILLWGISGRNPGRHRELQSMKTAELRPLFP